MIGRFVAFVVSIIAVAVILAGSAVLAGLWVRLFLEVAL